jgi:hypothetical protein
MTYELDPFEELNEFPTKGSFSVEIAEYDCACSHMQLYICDSMDYNLGRCSSYVYLLNPYVS